MRDAETAGWKTLLWRPFLHAAAAVVVGLIIVACATVPLTGRRQLNLVLARDAEDVLSDPGRPKKKRRKSTRAKAAPKPARRGKSPKRSRRRKR